MWWFTNMTQRMENIVNRDSEDATTSESVGSHTVTQTLGGGNLHMNEKNSFSNKIFTLSPDAEQVLIDMGWLEYRL